MTAYQFTNFILVLLRLLDGTAGGYHGGADHELTQGIKKCMDDLISLQKVAGKRLESINMQL